MKSATAARYGTRMVPLDPTPLPIDHVLRGAADAPALIDRAGVLTYAEAEGAMARLAGWLAAFGFAPGARVATWLPKTREACLMPLAAAASAHCCFRCSVGTTTATAATVRSAISSPAIRSANAVLPAPGVATARKSRGPVRRYRVIARRCHTRNAGTPETVPSDGALSGRSSTAPRPP